jgi:hypothetical protein
MDWQFMSWLSMLPSPHWVWFGIFVGVFALMATIFYQCLEKSKLKVFFESENTKSISGYKLIARIQNMPNNKFLAYIGVKRKSQDIRNLWISIKDKDGKEMADGIGYGGTVNRNIREIMLGNTQANLYTLSASLSSIIVDIAGIKSKNDGQVFVIDECGKFGKMLKVGLYTLTLELQTNGTPKIYKTEFQVNSNQPFVWVGKE